MRLNWLEWTKGEYPITVAYVGDFFASIRLMVPGEQRGWGNRAWSVNYDGKSVAAGTTFGTKAAEDACEFILNQCDAFSEGEK
jgi:hypothetical protein